MTEFEQEQTTETNQFLIINEMLKKDTCLVIFLLKKLT